MKQISSIITSMPVSSPRRRPNDISNMQSLGFATLIANPACSSGDFEDLAVFVGMPMCSGTGSEHDVVDRDPLFFVGENGVGPDVTSEGRAPQFGWFARCTGVADDCHRHDEI